MSSIWSRIRDGVATLNWSKLFGLAEEPPHSDLAASLLQHTPQQVGFTIAVIALGAKMAAADGTVTPSEIDAFHEVFQTPDEERANVRFIFDLARRSQAGADAYARQAARLLGFRKPLLEDLLAALFRIARADGVFDHSEDTYLQRVADIFRFDAAEYRRIRALYAGSEHGHVLEDDPWLILGLEPGATTEAVKARWRELVRENHPDLALARGLPAEFLSIANMKLARINAAYAALTRGAILQS